MSITATTGNRFYKRFTPDAIKAECGVDDEYASEVATLLRSRVELAQDSLDARNETAKKVPGCNDARLEITIRNETIAVALVDQGFGRSARFVGSIEKYLDVIGMAYMAINRERSILESISRSI